MGAGKWTSKCGRFFGALRERRRVLKGRVMEARTTKNGHSHSLRPCPYLHQLLHACTTITTHCCTTLPLQRARQRRRRDCQAMDPVHTAKRGCTQRRARCATHLNLHPSCLSSPPTLYASTSARNARDERGAQASACAVTCSAQVRKLQETCVSRDIEQQHCSRMRTHKAPKSATRLQRPWRRCHRPQEDALPSLRHPCQPSAIRTYPSCPCTCMLANADTAFDDVLKQTFTHVTRRTSRTPHADNADNSSPACGTKPAARTDRRTVQQKDIMR